MTPHDDLRPKLRPLEAFPLPQAGPRMVGLRDPSGLSTGVLSVSQPVLLILSHCDGTRTLDEIAGAFAAFFDRPLPLEQLQAIVAQLREVHFLDGEPFERYYQRLADQYRAAPARVMRSAAELGIDADIGRRFDDWLDGAHRVNGTADLVGLIAPHLDYARGLPCYAAAYAQLRDRPAPQRVVILGTNHFGRSSSVVATGKGFETPLGTTPADVAFIERLEAGCGALRRFEMDHQREHSIELQVLWCQHLFSAERFSLVPVLCPDPCGPTGTKPADGHGVDLREFARVLGECITDAGEGTLLIAGADLSHVGAHFGDERKLDDSFLPEVRERDQRALRALEERGPEPFLSCVAQDGNPTRICSAGCIFALLTALPGTQARVLKYHQAVHQPSQTGVTCAAVAVTR